MKHLSSRENALIKETIKLKQKKYRQQNHMFIAEGERLVREALACPSLLVWVFIDDNMAASFSWLENTSAECYMVDSSIIKAMSDTEHPQGLLAVLHMPASDPEKLKEKSAHLVLLDRMADPGNMGTIIRTAWAMDVEAVLLTPECVDPFSPKVVRSTMGGILHVPVHQVNTEFIDSLLQDGYRLLAASPNAASSIYEMDLTGPIISVIGSEAHGVGEEWLARAESKVLIPINPSVDSLNAAVSCAIIMAEARRQRMALP